ncbi:MAG: hypothetical protein F6J99_10050 [Moorea sp. SIO4G3]|nr:hypothetical protein [Moorena sp. SIO4G3]
MILRVFRNGHHAVEWASWWNGHLAVEWASCVEAMQRGLGGFPHERLHQDTGILPVSCLFPRGQDAHSTYILA